MVYRLQPSSRILCLSIAITLNWVQMGLNEWSNRKLRDQTRQVSACKQLRIHFAHQCIVG